MKTNSTLLRIVTLALALGFSVASGEALPLAKAPDGASPVISVAGDCFSIGQSVAAQKGGQLAKATAAERGGRKVCVVVVLVPGGNGQRPSREEVVVPLDD